MASKKGMLLKLSKKYFGKVFVSTGLLLSAFGFNASVHANEKMENENVYKYHETMNIPGQQGAEYAKLLRSGMKGPAPEVEKQSHIEEVIVNDEKVSKDENLINEVREIRDNYRGNNMEEKMEEKIQGIEEKEENKEITQNIEEQIEYKEVKQDTLNDMRKRAALKKAIEQDNPWINKEEAQKTIDKLEEKIENEKLQNQNVEKEKIEEVVEQENVMDTNISNNVDNVNQIVEEQEVEEEENVLSEKKQELNQITMEEKIGNNNQKEVFYLTNDDLQKFTQWLREGRPEPGPDITKNNYTKTLTKEDGTIITDVQEIDEIISKTADETKEDDVKNKKSGIKLDWSFNIKKQTDEFLNKHYNNRKDMSKTNLEEFVNDLNKNETIKDKEKLQQNNDTNNTSNFQSNLQLYLKYVQIREYRDELQKQLNIRNIKKQTNPNINNSLIEKQIN